MEAKIYFTIKLVCAVFIFRQLWIFIFNREMYGIWEKAYRLMRIVRINLWKYRKKRSEQKAREANKKARRREKTDAHNRHTAQPSSAVTEDVIGKTKLSISKTRKWREKLRHVPNLWKRVDRGG